MLRQTMPIRTDCICCYCGRESAFVSKSVGLCLECIRQNFANVCMDIQEVHQRARQPFNLPPQPPKSEDGIACHLCVNECQLLEGERSYCGLRVVEKGKLSGATVEKGNVSWYYDPLPTNCVADWVCPGGTGAGYPDYAYCAGPEYGYKNLAVFYQACSFDCLFCQNWHYRLAARHQDWVSASELAEAVDERTSCVCHFGGDPTPQLPHALRASRLAFERNKGRILRICWETNGSMHPALLKQAAELSLVSGGCIKFDLKAWSDELHVALCGVSNQRTLENFRFLASYIKERPQPPFLVASTLLIPGYVDKEEVFKIAQFIASLDSNIPYALLAFHPDFLMGDLPTTSLLHAGECLEAARKAGLLRLRIGNVRLLGNSY